MKILIMGNPDSIHVYNYIFNLINAKEHQIVIYDYTGNRIKESYIKRYAEFGINIISAYPKKGFILKLPYLRRSYIKRFRKKILNQIGEFDLCQIHFVSKIHCDLVWEVRRNYKNILLTYWGSDLFRVNFEDEEAQKRILSLNPYIIFTSFNLQKEFSKKYYGYHLEHSEIIDLGAGGISYIQALMNKNINSKFNSEKKITIACGYNASEAQQHYKILIALSKCRQEIKENLKLILILSYGNSNQDYINEIIELAKATGISYRIERDFMTYEEMANLCLQTDIYINYITTDALSSAMREFMFAGAVMIKGSWLQYDELINSGCYYEEVSDDNELTQVVENVVKNISFLKEKAMNNRTAIWNISSTEMLSIKWKKLFCKIEKTKNKG